jgi:ornithine cyclodeaminase/alanine dehydrogenase
VSLKTLILTDADVGAALIWAAAIAALRNAYGVDVTDAQFPRSMARGQGLWLRTLSGVMPGQKYLGPR